MAVRGKQGPTRGKEIPNPQAMAVGVNKDKQGVRKSQETLSLTLGQETRVMLIGRTIVSPKPNRVLTEYKEI